MDNLPYEIIAYNIFSHIKEKDLINNILLVDKRFYKCVMLYFSLKYKNNDEDFIKLSNYNHMFTEQIYAIKNINEIRKEQAKDAIFYPILGPKDEIPSDIYNPYNIIFKSPLGTGKTAVSLYFAIKSPLQTLILVTTRILTTWLEELKKFNLFDPDPIKSKVLFIHGEVCQKHRKFALKQNKFTNKLIITTTNTFYTSLKVPSFNSYSIFGKMDKNINLMIDEAHLFHDYGIKNLPDKNFNINICERFYISASPLKNICDRTKKKKIETYEVRCRNFNLDTKAIMDRVTIGNKIGGKYAKINFKEIDEYKYKNTSTSARILLIVSKLLNDINYKKIVVFSNLSKYYLDIISTNITKNKTDFNYYKSISFNNKAITHLEKFRKEDKIILLCNYKTSTEGINFSEADCAIYFEFEQNSPEKARQAVGRIKRKNNTNPDIDVYFSLNKKDNVIKMRNRLNQIYAKNFNFRNIEKKKNITMHLLIEDLKSNNYDLDKLTETEIIFLFGYNTHMDKNYSCFDNLDLKNDIKIDMKFFLQTLFKYYF